MSYQNDFFAPLPRKHCCLLDSSSSRRAGPSTRTRHFRICSSASPPPHIHSSQTNLDRDLHVDQRAASYATLLSQSDHSTRLSELRHPGSLYAVPQPGHMTAQRTQTLRARIASVILSIPATCEDVTDTDENEPREAVEAPPAAQVPKLRRVQGVRDLRRAFRDSEHGPTHFTLISSLGLSKASDEFGILPTSTLQSSSLSPRSSLRTLVDPGHTLHKSPSDLKTLRGSTLSSVSIASRLTTKVQSTFSPPRSSFTCLSTDGSHPIFPRRYPIHNSSIPQSHRRMSLQQDLRPPRSPGESTWSCAKISQSTVKLAARRGHTPRRVFSNPIAVLSS